MATCEKEFIAGTFKADCEKFIEDEKNKNDQAKKDADAEQKAAEEEEKKLQAELKAEEDKVTDAYTAPATSSGGQSVDDMLRAAEKEYRKAANALSTNTDENLRT
jgi:hypothetical protein